MKKVLSAFAAAFLLLTVLNPSALYALDMSAGVYTWYAWWDFPEDKYESTDTDPGLVYGPAFSVSIDKTLSLTFVFLYGEFSAEGKNSILYENYGGPINYFSYDIKRYDSDTALNIRLNDYLKLYIGAKYSAFNYDLKGTEFDIEFDHSSIGPGAGLSVTAPIGWNLFLTGNAGGMYLWGSEKSSASFGTSDKFDVKDYGYNAGVSMTYYIEPASASVSLGGRYQYIKTEYDDGYKNSSKFYGITLSALYIFRTE